MDIRQLNQKATFINKICRIYSKGMVCVLLSFTLALSSMSIFAEDGYRLGIGEVISISTFNEPELEVKQVRLGRTGKISFPLIGHVEVLNKTISEIEQEIEKRLRKGYLKKPKVTAKIVAYRDFYVNGQVNKPGAYSYSPGLTIRKAIAISGGLTDRASTKKISLKKEFGLAETTVVDVDTVMGPGDVLTIGESLF